MEELRAYLNSLTQEGQVAFVRRCSDTASVSSLRKAISAGDLLNPKLCVRIEFESGGKVTRRMLRPDDWYEYWPELAEKVAV